MVRIEALGMLLLTDSDLGYAPGLDMSYAFSVERATTRGDLRYDVPRSSSTPRPAMIALPYFIDETRAKRKSFRFGVAIFCGETGPQVSQFHEKAPTLMQSLVLL